MKTRIKKIRNQFGLTQEDFGKKIGIGKTSVSKLETGENKPSDQTIMLICREFNINENWLRDGVEPMYVKSSPYERAYNRFGYMMENSAPSKKAALSMLLELLYSVPDETWDSIMNEYEEIKKED